jgi:hypothetical protein
MNAGINLYLGAGAKKPVKIERKIEVKPKEKDLKEIIKVENIKSERESLQNIPVKGNKKVLSEVNQKMEDFDIKLKQHNENIVEEIGKYNLNKKLVNDKLKIKESGNNQIMINKSKPSTPSFKDIRDREMKVTRDFLKDDNSATGFIKEIIGSTKYDGIFAEGKKQHKETYYSFLQSINKALMEGESESSTNITLSDFIQKDTKEYDETHLNKVLDEVISNYHEIIKPKDEHDSVPVFRNNEVDSSDFNMCYNDDSDRFIVRSIGNNSEREGNIYQDSYENIDDDNVTDSNESHCEDEKVEVIKEKKVDEKEYKDLLELKEKFSNKLELYKEQAKLLCGDKDYNKIFDYYMEINKVDLF